MRRAPTPVSMRLLGTGLLKSLHPRGDDDFVDRLNYYYTPLILLAAATVISTKQFIMKPIQCWVPPQFTAPMEEYIEHSCWVQNTYWLPMHENIPDDHNVRDSKQIGYYQWVQLILIAEALLFALPCLVWRLTSWRSGLNLHYLVAAACDVHLLDSQEKPRVYAELASNLRSVLDLQSGVSKSAQRLVQEELFPQTPLSLTLALRFLRCCPYSGNFVTATYLCTKLLYTVNVVAQFFLLNAFLKSDDFHVYGLRVLSDVMHGRPWTESGHFPRVTLCDFEVRSLGNLNRYTVQCTLVANMFNEKIFVFVWILMCVLVGATLTSLFFWTFNTVFLAQRITFVLRYLRIAAAQSKADGLHRPSSSVYCAPAFVHDRFVDQYLGTDGVFALRVIANHAGDLVAMEIVKRLWKSFRDSQDNELVIRTSVEVGLGAFENPHSEEKSKFGCKEMGGGDRPDSVSPKD